MKAGQACPTVARATKRGSGAKKGLAQLVSRWSQNVCLVVTA